MLSFKIHASQKKLIRKTRTPGTITLKPNLTTEKLTKPLYSLYYYVMRTLSKSLTMDPESLKPPNTNAKRKVTTSKLKIKRRTILFQNLQNNCESSVFSKLRSTLSTHISVQTETRK